MKDRLTAGAMAGVIGALTQIIYGLTVKSIGLSNYVFTDFGKVLIMTKPKDGIVAFFIGATTHIILGALMGVVLSYVIKYTSSRFYILKGIGVGLSIWVFSFATGSYFRMPVFSNASIRVALTVLIGSTIYGLVTTYALKKITNNFRKYFGEDAKDKKPRMFKISPHPARKIEKEDRKVKLKKPIKLR